ncbi:hypothetical protein Salat_2397000 [Sesamum alatum]|uniref:Uncharacterized protein n=1 Tax=Sesamum alatum TaxID=300844 RepID=A0AAE2CF38_9LAMI|nr:hypothetical protein Salat_2397000 [Sesamum alatum]
MEKKFVLQALTRPPQPQGPNTEEISKVLIMGTKGSSGQLYSISAQTPLSPQQDEELKQLLDSYAEIFQEPQSLPRDRTTQHQINLKADVVPTKMAPYMTDQQSLKHILEQRVDTMLQQKWIAKLLGLDYTVEYNKGSALFLTGFQKFSRAVRKMIFYNPY